MRNNHKRQSHVVDLFFTLSLFCLFAASALIVVLIGSGVYRTTTSNMEENYSVRTAVAYVAEKVRQHDISGGSSISTIEGDTMLVFTDTVEGTDYHTYIYAYNGFLCELVIRDGNTFSRDQGEQILKVDSFSLSDEGNGFIKVTAADSGSAPVSCLLHLRSSNSGSVSE